jgi:hypothetical protein
MFSRGKYLIVLANRRFRNSAEQLFAAGIGRAFDVIGRGPMERIGKPSRGPTAIGEAIAPSMPGNMRVPAGRICAEIQGDGDETLGRTRLSRGNAKFTG